MIMTEQQGHHFSKDSLHRHRRALPHSCVEIMLPPLREIRFSPCLTLRRAAAASREVGKVEDRRSWKGIVRGGMDHRGTQWRKCLRSNCNERGSAREVVRNFFPGRAMRWMMYVRRSRSRWCVGRTSTCFSPRGLMLMQRQFRHYRLSSNPLLPMLLPPRRSTSD